MFCAFSLLPQTVDLLQQLLNQQMALEVDGIPSTSDAYIDRAACHHSLPSQMVALLRSRIWKSVEQEILAAEPTLVCDHEHLVARAWCRE